MKPLFVLYMKELKDNRNLFLFLLIATVSLDLYAFFEIDEKLVTTRSPSAILIVLLFHLPLFTAILIPPFILAHSFSSEWKAETYHLMFSLPIHKGWIVFLKLIAILTIGFVLFMVSCLGFLLFFSKVTSFANSNSSMPSAFDFWFLAGGWYLSILLLLLGIVSCMEGLRFAVKRYRRLVSLGFLVTCFYFLGRIMKPATEALSFLGKYQIEIINQDGGVFYKSMSLSWLAFPILCGLLLLLLGIDLFDRYVEI